MKEKLAVKDVKLYTFSVIWLQELHGLQSISFISSHSVISMSDPVSKINVLGVSLDKVLILDRYSLFEVELGWFCYSLFIRNKKYNTLYKILERIIKSCCFENTPTNKNMFKVNNKDTNTASIIFFGYFYY